MQFHGLVRPRHSPVQRVLSDPVGGTCKEKKRFAERAVSEGSDTPLGTPPPPPAPLCRLVTRPAAGHPPVRSPGSASWPSRSVFCPLGSAQRRPPSGPADFWPQPRHALHAHGWFLRTSLGTALSQHSVPPDLPRSPRLALSTAPPLFRRAAAFPPAGPRPRRGLGQSSHGVPRAILTSSRNSPHHAALAGRRSSL